jgi:hypothetical protein
MAAGKLYKCVDRVCVCMVGMYACLLLILQEATDRSMMMGEMSRLPGRCGVSSNGNRNRHNLPNNPPQHSLLPPHIPTHPHPNHQRWKKVIGVEYLAGLHKEAQRYLGKYKGGSPVTLVNKDFVDVSLADADVVFLYATKCVPALGGGVLRLGIL